jgi:hypothetical protein
MLYTVEAPPELTTYLFCIKGTVPRKSVWDYALGCQFGLGLKYGSPTDFKMSKLPISELRYYKQRRSWCKNDFSDWEDYAKTRRQTKQCG